MKMKTKLLVALLVALLVSGVSCVKDSLFVYSRLGGQALLPCTSLTSTRCSHVSWTFYKGGQVRYSEEVREGRVQPDSDRSDRTSLTANCSLSLRRLRPEDAGSYVCLERQAAVAHVYLSLLGLASPSSVLDLQAGGRLVLRCLLFSFYDAGSCKSYASRTFRLSWRGGAGGELPADRLQLTEESRCNLTLSTTLQPDDHLRRWRCHLNTTSHHADQYLDFTSTFWSQNAYGDRNRDRDQGPSEGRDCSTPLPISQVVLCVLLPLMVVSVGLFTWKLDHKRAKASAATGRIQESSLLQLGGVHIPTDPAQEAEA